MSEWVSVEDRLPEYQARAGSDSFTFVIVALKGMVFQAMFCNGRFDGQAMGDITERVTHWMPLPEPPTND